VVGAPGPDVIQMVLLLPTERLTLAWPGSAPPIRKKTSCSAEGSELELGPSGVPNCRSRGEFGIPASKIIPETITPCAGRTIIDTIPFSGIRVGKPIPSTTVSGRVTNRV